MAGENRGQGDRGPVLIGNLGRICNNKAFLGVDAVRITGIDEPVGGIHRGNPVSGGKGVISGWQLLADDEIGHGLGGTGGCNIRRKLGIDISSGLDIGKIHLKAEGIDDDSIWTDDQTECLRGKGAVRCHGGIRYR